MRFGGVTALDDVSFHVDQGEILGLIGPNGAGKTTVFNVVTGVYRPTAGVVRFDGRTLRKERRSDITKLGIARTFQNIRLFPVMTALENVMVAADAHNRSSVGGALVRVGRFRNEEQNSYDKAMELLAFMKLDRRKDEYAKNLPYGDQRRLEIARAMATDPKLLCLDEPAAGFNPAEKQSLMELIRTHPGAGLHGAAHRARHEPGDGRHRPHRGARLRPQDRRWQPGRGPDQPRCHPGLPRSARRCFLRFAT